MSRFMRAPAKVAMEAVVSGARRVYLKVALTAAMAVVGAMSFLRGTGTPIL